MRNKGSHLIEAIDPGGGLAAEGRGFEALTATFRRRLDNLVLRWQARLDSEWSDRTLPWIVALALFVLLAALSLARARSLDGTARPFDLHAGGVADPQRSRAVRHVRRRARSSHGPAGGVRLLPDDRRELRPADHPGAPRTAVGGAGAGGGAAVAHRTTAGEPTCRGRRHAGVRVCGLSRHAQPEPRRLSPRSRRRTRTAVRVLLRRNRSMALVRDLRGSRRAVPSRPRSRRSPAWVCCSPSRASVAKVRSS